MSHCVALTFLNLLALNLPGLCTAASASQVLESKACATMPGRLCFIFLSPSLEYEKLRSRQALLLQARANCEQHCHPWSKLDRQTMRHLLPLNQSLPFWKQGLMKPRLASSLQYIDDLIAHIHLPGWQAYAIMRSFYVESNPGFHACQASALPPEPRPQSLHFSEMPRWLKDLTLSLPKYPWYETPKSKMLWPDTTSEKFFTVHLCQRLNAREVICSTKLLSGCI